MKAKHIPRPADTMRRGRSGWLGYGVFAVLTSLVATLLVVAVPTAARAAEPDPNCQEFRDGKVPLGDGHSFSSNGRWLFVFFVKFREPTFFKGDGKTLENETDAAATRTATTTVSMTRSTQEVRTRSVTATRTVVKVALNATEQFSKTITESVTVSDTVTDAFTVPARTAIQADRGIFGFRTIVDLDVWEIGGGRCWYQTGQDGSPRNLSLSVVADAGWRTLTYPRINVGGIINGNDYTYTIYPGTTIAIFGKDFAPPGDKVTVRQGSNQWTIQHGSPWWYDSLQQINATLPATLVPGTATVTVTTPGPNGLESLTPRTIIIS